jgi:hypothetical protein
MKSISIEFTVKKTKKYEYKRVEAENFVSNRTHDEDPAK